MKSIYDFKDKNEGEYTLFLRTILFPFYDDLTKATYGNEYIANINNWCWNRVIIKNINTNEFFNISLRDLIKKNRINNDDIVIKFLQEYRCERQFKEIWIYLGQTLKLNYVFYKKDCFLLRLKNFTFDEEIITEERNFILSLKMSVIMRKVINNKLITIQEYSDFILHDIKKLS